MPSNLKLERTALPLQIETAVQKIHKVYSSLLHRRIGTSSSVLQPEGVSLGSGAALSSLFDISEAYRQAVAPLGDEEGSGFWALLSLLLCFWEEASCHAPLSNAAVTHTPLNSLNIAPTMQRWYRANVFNFSCVLEELDAFRPADAAQEVMKDSMEAGEEDGVRAAQMDRVLLLLEVLVRLMMCGAFELAAVVYDRLVLFFRCCEQLQEDYGGSGKETIQLTAEMESCFAAVKRLLLIPVAESEEDVGCEDDIPAFAQYSSQHKVGCPTVERTGQRGAGGKNAVFASPAAHKEWQAEANNLVYTTKRVVGDWIHRSPAGGGNGDNEVVAEGGMVAYLFRQFCLVTLDALLMMSGDALLMEENCLESELSLMGYLVGVTTLCEPFMTMSGLRLLLEESLQRDVWQEALQISPRMVSTLLSSFTSRGNKGVSEEMDAMESDDDVEGGDTPQSSQNPAWQYFLLWRLLACESLADVPGALRTSMMADIQPARHWQWDPSSLLPAMNEEDDEDEDEDDDEDTLQQKISHSYAARQSIRRFIIAAMCAFVADLTAIPVCLNSPPTTLDSVPSPEVLIHRYILLDQYLDLLRGPDEDTNGDRSTTTRRFSSPTLWPITLTLLLASPLHNPQTLCDAVMDIARLSLCDSSHSRLVQFNAQSYHRLISFLCAGAEEIPTPMDPQWMTMPASTRTPTRITRSSLLSWHPQSALQEHVFAVLQYFGVVTAAEQGEEEEEDLSMEANLSSGTSFEEVVRQWKHRREEVRQQAIRDVHGYIVEITVQKGLNLPSTSSSSCSSSSEQGGSTAAPTVLSSSTAFTASPLILAAWLTRQYSFLSSGHIAAGMQRETQRPTLSSRLALLQRKDGGRDGKALGHHCGCTPALEVLISALRVRLTSPFLMEQHALEVKVVGDAVEHQFISSCPILNAAGYPKDEIDAECSALLEAYSRIAVVLRRTAVMETAAQQLTDTVTSKEKNPQTLSLHLRLLESIADLFRTWDTSSSAAFSSSGGAHSTTTSSSAPTPHTLQSYCIRARLHPRVQYMLIERALESLLTVRTLLKESGTSLLRKMPMGTSFLGRSGFVESIEEEEQNFWFLLSSTQLPFFCRAFEMAHVLQWDLSGKASAAMMKVHHHVNVFSASKEKPFLPSFEAVRRCVAEENLSDGFHPPNCVERKDREENIRRLFRIIAES